MIHPGLKSKFLTGIFVCISATLPATSTLNAANLPILELVDVPLYLNDAVIPNVFWKIDDSGSMDWEFMTVAHFREDTYVNDYSSGSSYAQPTTNGLYRNHDGSRHDYYEYVFENSDNAYSTRCDGSRTSLEECPPTHPRNSDGGQDWRQFSAALNPIYFNPENTYSPWIGFPDSDVNAARSDPQSGSDGYNLRRNLFADDFRYEIWFDDKGFDGNYPKGDDDLNVTSGENGWVDLWDSHVTVTVSEDSVTAVLVNYAPMSDDTNPTTTNLGSVAGSPYTGGLTLSELQQNIANWYTYHRRRASVTKAALAASIDRIPNFRYGLSVINEWNYDGNLFVEMPSVNVSDFSSHNTALLEEMFEFDWPARGTPLRTALARVGNYYAGDLSGKDSPIVYSCQKNFTVLFTDGFYNGSDPNISDEDGDGHSNTLADVAKQYYDNDLSDLTNNVPPDPFDTATYQHMVTFSVAFGVKGNLNDSDDDGWPNPVLSESSNWGDPDDGNPEKIDDMWHAAFNSKGRFLSAKNPTELVESLTSTLQNISERTGSSSGVSISTGVIAGEALAYRTGFDSSSWSGTVQALRISSDGSINDVVWDAACLLNGGICDATGGNDLGPARLPSTRSIITRNDQTGLRVNFDSVNMSATLEALSPSQQAALNTNPQDGTTDGLGAERLDYIRGTREQETANGGPFRTRTSVLGDIIHSGATYVQRPADIYPDEFPDDANETPYAAFVESNINRASRVYVGGNDGMLHAFNALEDGGDEVWAYIPGFLVGKLNELTRSDYQHTSFADLTPNVRDVFYGGSWHSVLITGTRHGGQGIYALDITNPNDPQVLWEFTDENSANLGYVYDQPFITRLATGQWVAVVGNGYNASEHDDNQGTDNSGIFVIDIASGTGQFTATGAGSSGGKPNGTAGVTVVDENNDFVADYAYVGDRMGNMWRFDNLSSSAPASVNLLYATSSESGVAPGDKSFTTRPEVALDPQTLDVVVYIGSGSYIEDSDRFSTDTQTFYGIRDKGEYPNTGNFITQSISTSGSVRFITSNQISGDHGGWKIDLPASGERQVTDAFLRSGIILFSSLIPETTDPCVPGGVSWVMAVDPLNGGQPEGNAPFDTNGDGVIDESDVGMGVLVEDVIVGAATAVVRGARDLLYLNTSNGDSGAGIDTIALRRVDERRRSWRQRLVE